MTSTALAEQIATSEIDRRSHPRRTISELPWLMAVRLKYGPAVTLVDLSCGGAQIETEGRRLHPGSAVVVQIEGEGTNVVIPAQVLRCQVMGLSPYMIYRSALVFRRSLRFPDVVSANAGPGHSEANLSHDHARLSLALKRRLAASDVRGASNPGESESSAVSVGAEAMAAAFAMMEVPAARRAEIPFTRELSRMFNLVVQGLDEKAPPDELLGRMVEHLRRGVPASMIRLVEGPEGDRPLTHGPICFDVDSGGQETTARLLVDCPSGSRMQEWHFQYLKAAVHLLALVKALERRPGVARPEEAAEPVEEELPAGWHRLVVRYTDGQLLKGYGRDFSALSSSLQVWPAPDSSATGGVTVPLGRLKAVFFVRDFDGDPLRVEGADPGPDVRGRRVVVTFLDGETLAGATLNYNPGAAGFFVRPFDSGGNNLRTFAAAGAVRHVHFP